MKLLRIGCNYRHPSRFRINRPNGSGDYLFLIIKTAAFAVIGGERVSVPPNSVLLYKEGTPQLYGASGGPFINDWMHFDADPADEELIAALGIPYDAVIPLRDVTELSDLLKNIFRERFLQDLVKEAIVQRYFELILLKLSEKIRGQTKKQQHPCYDAFCRLRSEIRLEPQKCWSVDTVCRKMNLSRSYVQHCYKLFFGVSITDDVQNGRMEHAKYLLSSTDMTVRAVSLSCGYQNDVHFMRVFKQQNGTTPSGFRASFRSAGGR
ncbi:MAG: helix-turn-helix transcriptional regulator [Clostridia bacterium]|nr:helix-turn-helix transcriptional regulator [Clostridia bacterium]